MNIGKSIGLILLAIIWLWLCWMLLTSPHGFNLKNLFIAGASGIIIFVPLWKKYFGKAK